MSLLDQTYFNWADWTIVAVVGLSTLISVTRGLVKEALSLLVWAAAFAVAFSLSDKLAIVFTDSISTPSLRYFAAFALLFVSMLILGALVNYIVGQLVRMTGLSGTDRLLGMLFGVCRGVLIVLALLIFVPSFVPVKQDAWWQQSILVPRVLVLESWSRNTVADVSSWGKTQVEKHEHLIEKSH